MQINRKWKYKPTKCTPRNKYSKLYNNSNNNSNNTNQIHITPQRDNREKEGGEM